MGNYLGPYRTGASPSHQAGVAESTDGKEKAGLFRFLAGVLPIPLKVAAACIKKREGKGCCHETSSQQPPTTL